LILTAGVASWTQIRDVRGKATVIQTLPSGNIGDVSGAQLATLEKVWMCDGGEDEFDIVQVGKAYITANHPILIGEDWMLASQAAEKGHGKLSYDRDYSQLCSLQLATGGNVLINISISPDLPHVYTETATMGCRFLPPSNPLNRNFPIYDLQGTDLRNDSVAQTRPSYSQVLEYNLTRWAVKPILPLTTLTPEAHVLTKARAELEKDVKRQKGEPKTGNPATIHLGAIQHREHRLTAALMQL